MKYNLSQETLNAIHTAGKKKWIKNIVKTIAFCAITEALLFVCNNFGDFFNRKKNPVLFWGLFAFIIIIYVWKFKTFAPLFRKSFGGQVAQIKNDVVIDGVEKDVKGGWVSTPSTDLGKVDSCTIIVRNEKGDTSEYVFKRGLAPFARSYYRIGDNVFFPKYARYPFNNDNKMPRPFCINCGDFIDEEEMKCEKCGVPLSTETTNEEDE